MTIDARDFNCWFRQEIPMGNGRAERKSSNRQSFRRQRTGRGSVCVEYAVYLG